MERARMRRLLGSTLALYTIKDYIVDRVNYINCYVTRKDRHLSLHDCLKKQKYYIFRVLDLNILLPKLLAINVDFIVVKCLRLHWNTMHWNTTLTEIRVGKYY